ncbi:MAG: hypothetical protein WAM79_17820 [Candidatus Sulfotelmatobacter sp.]
MSKFAIVSTLAICATALVIVPVVTPARAATSHVEHIKKHMRAFAWSPGFGDPWSAGQIGPVTRPSGRAGGGVQASPEVSTVRRGLLRSMKIPIESQAMAAAAKPT